MYCVSINILLSIIMYVCLYMGLVGVGKIYSKMKVKCVVKHAFSYNHLREERKGLALFNNIGNDNNVRCAIYYIFMK